MNGPSRTLVTLLCLALPVACGSDERGSEATSATTPDADAEVAALIAEQTSAFLRDQPLRASFLDVPETLAGGPYGGRLSDYSPSGFAATRELSRASANALAVVPREGLPARTQLDLEVVERVHRYYGGAEGIGYGYIDDYLGHLPYVVSQISGPLIDVPKVMTAQQRLASAADAEDYLDRLAAFETMLGGVLEKLRADAALGVVPPPAVLRGAIAYIEGFVGSPPSEHSLVTHLTEKLATLELAGAERDRLRQRAEELLETAVVPGYRAIAAELSGLADRVPEGDGIWAQPGGERFYAHLVDFLGDTELAPEAIHQLGLKEVERILAQMDTILRSRGLTEGTVGERMTALGAQERFLYANTDEGRAELLASLSVMVDGIMARIDEAFATIPPQGLEIRRIPPEIEAGSSGGYYTNPSLDGSRPGVYWINLRDTASWPSFALPTLTYHEAVPGHHFQMALAMEVEGLPFLRANAPFNAFVEGWALYGERVAWEMGLYADDPYGDLGRLQAELYRAVRLVVDTGLHHHRWSREKAIDYFAATTGRTVGRSTAEIERYMAWPGQALGYKLGMLKLLELRQEAETTLGERFDQRAFHDRVLLQAALPMQVLERLVGEWIEARAAP